MRATYEEDRKSCFWHCSCVDEEVFLKCNDYSAGIRRPTKEQFLEILEKFVAGKIQRLQGQEQLDLGLEMPEKPSLVIYK